MTTIKQRAEQIRVTMARRPKANRADVALSMIKTVIAMGGDLDEVKRILAAEQLLRQETTDALAATGDN